MSYIYLDIGEYVENKTFLVFSPLYASLQSEVIEDKIIEQIYVPDKNEFGRSRMTIKMMIDYVKKSIPFSFINVSDILEIKKNLDEYIETIQKAISIKTAADEDNPNNKNFNLNDKKVTDLLKDAMALKPHIDKIFVRYLNLNPALKKEYGENDLTSLIKKYE